MHSLIKKTVALTLAALTAASLSSCALIDRITGKDGEPSGSASPSHTSAPVINGSVVINEAVSSNVRSVSDPTFGSPDWVELYNPSDKEADISGASLSDTPTMQNALVFPNGTKLAPHGFITVFCIAGAENASAEGSFVAPFGISSSGEKLYFESASGAMDIYDIPALPPDVSYARAEDGSYGFAATPTFGAANGPVYTSLDELHQADPTVDALRISELVPGQEGWVELENSGSEAVSLASYYLSDDERDPGKWHFPDMSLEPGALVVVELNELAPEDPLTASFKLGKDENGIYLFNSQHKLVDELEFQIPLIKGLSVIPSEGGAGYCGIVTKGEPNSDSVFAYPEWIDLDPSDPSVRLYINEVLPSNKYSAIDCYGDRSDWVELLNPSDSPAHLENYFLSDDPEDPLKYRLPQIELQPHSYALVFLSGKEGAEDELHAPFSLSNGECIMLSTLDGMKRDMIEIPDDLPSNVSIGRNSGNALRYYSAPTPGASNSTYAFEDYSASMFDPNSLYISEVSAVAPARSGGVDWIELYNGSGSAIDLTGWGLTDDLDQPDKFKFSGSSVSAGGYATISCEEGAKAGSGRAAFSVSNTGETIFLLDPRGFVRDVFATGVTRPGTSSGRAAGSSDGARCFFVSPTRGAKNSTPYSGVTAEPTFSKGGLYCTSAFDLTISCSTPGAEIRYTTDGSDPTTSSKLYTEPIRISSGTVIKATAYHDGLLKSPVGVKTYVFADEHTVPVISLSMSKSDYSRMYVATARPNGGVIKGDEVSCYMEYYIDGRLAFSTGAGVRVSGASTSLYSQKGLGLYFRAGFGRSSVDFPLFKGCDVKSFRSLTLRNAGQDAPYARMRDAYMSRVCQGLNIDVAYIQPVAVYINGEYRGLYDMKENMNEDYLVSHFGVDRDKVEIIARNGKVLSGGSTRWYDVRHLCQTLDFSRKENYEKLLKVIDEDCVIDYLIARSYFYDGDMFNQKYWHTTDNSVKWRPVFFDSDYAMNGNSVGGNILPLYFKKAGFTTFHGSVINMDIFCAFNQNKEWRDKFITRYIYVVKHQFKASRALPIFDQLVAELKPEMRRQISRWHMPSSYDKWTSEVSAFRSCVERRATYALRNLRNYYGLSESQFAEYERKAG